MLVRPEGWAPFRAGHPLGLGKWECYLSRGFWCNLIGLLVQILCVLCKYLQLFVFLQMFTCPPLALSSLITIMVILGMIIKTCNGLFNNNA